MAATGGIERHQPLLTGGAITAPARGLVDIAFANGLGLLARA